MRFTMAAAALVLACSSGVWAQDQCTGIGISWQLKSEINGEFFDGAVAPGEVVFMDLTFSAPGCSIDDTMLVITGFDGMKFWFDLGHRPAGSLYSRAIAMVIPDGDPGDEVTYMAEVFGTWGDGSECLSMFQDTKTLTVMADANRDNTVDVSDLITVLFAYGSDDYFADTDGSGVVDIVDLTEVVLAWRK